MDLLRELCGARTVGISGHERPDGYSIGSSMAAALYIRKMMPGTRVDVFCQELPDSLKKNIPFSDTVISDGVSDVEAYDCFIAIDTGKDRLAEAETHFDRAVKTINIDHHISNPGTGMVNCVDPAASSACEVLYGLLDPSCIDSAIARCLYIGMVTDSGVFRYSSTSRRTMEIAGSLLEFCPDFPEIVSEVFFEKSFLQQKVIGRVLNTCRALAGGRLIVGMLSYEEMQEMGADQNDLDGLSAQLNLTTGAEASMFISGLEPDHYRASLRSGRNIDVAAIAGVFGGGGHVQASGFSFEGDPEEKIAMIAGMVEEQLDGKA